MELQLYYDKGDQKGIIELAEKLNNKVFTAKDLGISYRTINHWESEDILLESRDNEKGWRKFSFLDYVWLKLVEELRTIGLNIQAIKTLKGSLKELTGFIVEHTTTHEMVAYINTKKKNQLKPFKVVSKSTGKKQLVEQFIKFDVPYAQLMNHLVNSIITRRPFSIYVNNRGKQTICFDDDLDKIDSISWKSYIKVSVGAIIQEFTGKQEYEKYLPKLSLLSEDELEVLKLLRKGDLTSLTVRFDKKGKINLIEESKEGKIDAESRLTELILSGGYQNISLTTQKGKVISFQNTVKHKLN